MIHMIKKIKKIRAFGIGIRVYDGHTNICSEASVITSISETTMSNKKKKENREFWFNSSLAYYVAIYP